MNLLLDSHTLLWALHDPERLRVGAAEAIRDPARAIYFSAASVWELELKAAKGKLDLPAGWIESAEGAGFLQLPVRGSEAAASARLPWHHTDPFDRILLAQANAHGLQFATRDSSLAMYGVPLFSV